MRHTLITTEKKAVLHREYHERAMAVSMLVLAVSITVGAAAVFPAFVESWLAKQSGLSAVAAARNGQSQSAVSAAADELSQQGAIVSMLYADASLPSFSSAIGAIAAERGPVEISSFSIQRGAKQSMTVTLQGNAPTRDDLLGFQNRLEAMVPGASVELPIGELAKSTDIQFSIQITGGLP